MAQVIKRSLSITAASAASSEWIILNTFQENFFFGFSIKKTGIGVAPVVHLQGTMENPIVTPTVSATDVFSMVSAVSTSSIGTNIAGQISFPVAAVRISTISGGSGASTLTLNVLETGKY
jgi:hypothetical protein